ncbi:MAG: hypothetical protein COB67_05430 [SAR324 cluster bacterium]|uniref:Outer membrane lipoprotein BamD-like domain-containing protein n=1 Tax=SAR324 cluster bacterium TaxID=2024889 RepID=A0A2A4T638_9DELT|nr:MAG: hypothetical protein COB67_05430 [SAR324 cluster bacterium]
MFKKVIWLFLVIVLLISPLALLQAQNRLQKIEYRSQGEFRTLLQIYNREIPHFEVFENLKARVLIIKFRNTDLGNFPKLQLFDDPLINGIQTQQIDQREYWVKIRTRYSDLRYRIIPQKKDPTLLTLEISRPVSAALELTGPRIINMLRELHPRSERLILYLDKPVQQEIIKEKKKEAGNLFQVRFLNTQIAKDVIIPDSATKIIKKIAFVKRGKYLFMEISPQRFSLRVQKQVIQKPLRVIFNITEDRQVSVAAQEKEAEAARVEKEAQQAELDKKIRFLEEKFQIAEQNFKRGRFEEAALQFKNIYNFAPDSGIGVRAHFRSADAYFQKQVLKNQIGEDTFVIQEYKAAITSALSADTGYEDIPRAYYNLGRSYLNLKFYEDAFNQFEIIRKFYPESPYSKNALLQQGKVHLNMLRYEKAIENLQQFVTENAKAPQIAEAYYKIGEALFQLKKYEQAKVNFDRAWSLNGELMKQDPELMFHMGEAYFENQEFQTARSLYEELMDLYPRESFSNLVAIRIGDFLRAEEKEDDAIKAYERAIVQYTRELLLIGKLRIANILAEKPEENQYQEALKIYDFILEKYPLSDQVEESMLRKALTLALFQHYADAIKSLDNFCQNYPENIYVQNHIIHERILDSISGYIADYYYQGRYLDALGVFEQYEKKYFLRPQGSACFRPSEKLEFGARVKPILDRAPLFLIADSYFRLGLQDEALKFFEEVLKEPDDPLVPLVKFNQGRVYDAQDNPDKARKVYVNFIAKHPEHIYTSVVKKALGDSYFRLHKFDRIDRAIRIYRQTIKNYKDSDNPLDREIVPASWFTLGSLYQGIGQYDNSIKAYKNVLRSYEHPLQDEAVEDYIVETHFILGNLFLELNQFPEALKAYNQAIELFPDSDKTPWAKYQKGQIFVRNKQKDKALKIFEELIDEASKQPEALWGPLARESYEAMTNELSFEKYLNRSPSAAGD